MNQSIEQTQIENLKRFVRHSGYPFENEIDAKMMKVASTIANRKIAPSSGWDVFLARGYNFKTVNEDNHPILRSIDFVLRLSIPMELIPHSLWRHDPSNFLTLNFLVDAKFTETCNWLFIPSHNRSQDFLPYAYPEADIRGERYSLPIVKEIARIKSEWPIVSGGKKVDITKSRNEQSSERDTITAFQIQLLKATLSEMSHIPKGLWKNQGGSFPNAQIFIPIIVTNAPIYLVKEGITLADVSLSKTMGEICKEVDVVCLAWPDIAQTHEMIRRADNDIRNCKIDALQMRGGTQNVPVLFVNQHAVEHVLDGILQKALKCGQHIE